VWLIFIFIKINIIIIIIIGGGVQFDVGGSVFLRNTGTETSQILQP